MTVHSSRFMALMATATLAASIAEAAPRSGEGSGSRYLISAETLSSWHAGAYLRRHNRTLKNNGQNVDVETRQTMAYVGRDLFPWMTLYGTLGAVELKEKWISRSDDTAAYGVGLWLNLLDHDTFEYLETVQRFRVQATLQYMMFRTRQVTWGEFSGHLSFGITHETLSSKFFWPEAMTLYAGPAFNVPFSDEYDPSSDNTFGVTVGLDVQVNRLTSIGASLEMYQDDDAATAYVTLRF